MKYSEELQWQDGAACRRLPAGFEQADFFPDNRRSSEAKLAKQFCAVCPIRVACLEWALDHDERWGIWGGTDHKDRAWLKNPTMTTEEADA